jgi:pimeloyl-ACP methyl ester carboxylesterase
VNIPWQTGTVESAGETIYYESIGDADAPTIMLTHGAGGSHAAWFQNVPVLVQAGYRVITWDCRGFGNSTFATGVHGIDAAIADMEAVLAATGTDRAHLAGQSMGGWWVVAFTLAYPERVPSLTLSNTVGGLWTDALDAHFREWIAGGAGFATPTLGQHNALSPGFAKRDLAHAFLYQQLNTFHTPPMAAIAGAIMETRVDHAALDATGVPVLVITGEHDALFPAQLVQDSASRLANARSVEVADAGHSPYFERPEEYNAALMHFVGAATSPSPHLR